MSENRCSLVYFPTVIPSRFAPRYMLADKAGDWLFNLAMEGFKLFALEPEQVGAWVR